MLRVCEMLSLLFHERLRFGYKMQTKEDKHLQFLKIAVGYVMTAPVWYCIELDAV